MAPLVLAIGNRNYSSWSLRPWLALKATGAAFEEVVVPLDGEGAERELLRLSPSGKVPALSHGGLVVWESLAICEYVADLFPEARLWPSDKETRALARSVATEMHAGFFALRERMGVNIRRRFPRGTGLEEPGVRADVARVLALWEQCLARTCADASLSALGPFLFGAFGIVDAMYAPVVTRFVTYDFPLEGNAKAYADAVLAYPPMAEWIALAHAESWSMAKYEKP